VKRSTKSPSPAELEIEFQAAQQGYRRALRVKDWAEAETCLTAAIKLVERGIGTAMAWAHQARESLAAVQQLRRISRLFDAKKQTKEKRECARKTAA
jgi:hypothetical protein